jgi:hypothetical protein
MDYGRLIARAFQITFRYRFLWGLGILAAFTEGGAGFNIPNPGGFDHSWPGASHHYDRFSLSLQHFSFSVRSFFPSELFSRFGTFGLAELGLGLLVMIVLLALFLGLALFVISLMAGGGLIDSVAGIERREPVWFGRGFRAGYHAFWRIVAVGLLTGLAVLGALIVLSLPVVVLALTKHYWVAVGLGIVEFLIFLAIVIYLGILVMYARRIILIENGGVQASLSGAHQLIRRNLGPVLLVWLLTLAFAIGYAIAIVIALLVVLIPLGLLGWGIYAGLGQTATIVYAVIFGLLLLAGLVLLQGMMTAFNSSFWTLAYLELTRPKVLATEIPVETPA